jgi:hypothetical protein
MEAFELIPDPCVVRAEKLAPPLVTEVDSPLRRADHVREQHRRQHALRRRH